MGKAGRAQFADEYVRAWDAQGRWVQAGTWPSLLHHWLWFDDRSHSLDKAVRDGGFIYPMHRCHPRGQGGPAPVLGSLECYVTVTDGIMSAYMCVVGAGVLVRPGTSIVSGVNT